MALSPPPLRRLAGLAAAGLALLVLATAARAAPTELFISEYVDK